MAASLPCIHVRGTNYEIGYAMGEAYRHVIQDQMNTSHNLQHILLPIYSTEGGRRKVETFLDTSTRYYPQYIQEMRGIADGAQVDFLKLFIVHLEVELTQHIGTPVTTEGCSDLYLNTPDTSILAHSEDVGPDTRDNGYLVHAHVLPSEVNGFKEEMFTAYSSPGCLQGNTLAFNKHGLAVTLNILFQQQTNYLGIPRRVMNRAVLAAESLDEVNHMLTKPPGVATGFNYNLGQQAANGVVEMRSVEVYGVDGRTEISCKTVQGFDYHFNDYRRLDLAWIPDPSASRRVTRLEEIIRQKTPVDITDIRCIMGDTVDKDFPFYRNGKEPDYLATACIGLFNFQTGELDVFRSNPSSSDPIARLTMPSNQNANNF